MGEMGRSDSPDFRAIFEAIPGRYLIYLARYKATGEKRIIGIGHRSVMAKNGCVQRSPVLLKSAVRSGSFTA
jgi:hypothetical protein